MPDPIFPIPLAPGESCADAEFYCELVGAKVAACNGSMFHCTPPTTPGTPGQQQPPPKDAWGLLEVAGLGLLLGAIALAAYYTDPNR